MSEENGDNLHCLVGLLNRWKTEADKMKVENDFSPHGTSEFSMTHGEYTQILCCIADVEELLEANDKAQILSEAK